MSGVSDKARISIVHLLSGIYMYANNNETKLGGWLFRLSI
jgi:hypothetical protein